jgi:hypothetical protein
MKRMRVWIGVFVLLISASLVFAQVKASETPFSDAIARSNALVFDMSQFVTLNGTITGEVVHINRGPAYYFRTEVKEDGGKTSVWAVLVRVHSPDELAPLKSGASVRIRGRRAKDGTLRLVAYPEDITITPR